MHYSIGQKWKLIQAYGNKRDTSSDGFIYELKQMVFGNVGLIDKNKWCSGYCAVKDPANITQNEWDTIAGMNYFTERKWELMAPDYNESVTPYIPSTRVLKWQDIQSRIHRLWDDIRREKNSKEKARLIDEQAALQFTLRIMDIYTTTGKCVK